MFQHALVRAEIELRAARALLKSEAESLWGLLSAGRLLLRLSKLDALRRELGRPQMPRRWWTSATKPGAEPLPYDSSPLQRHLRDITLTQHIPVDEWVTRAGAFSRRKGSWFWHWRG